MNLLRVGGGRDGRRRGTCPSHLSRRHRQGQGPAESLTAAVQDLLMQRDRGRGRLSG